MLISKYTPSSAHTGGNKRLNSPLKRKTLAVIAALFIATQSTQALTPVTFDFTTGDVAIAGDNQSDFTMTVGDLTMSLSTSSNWHTHTGTFLFPSGPPSLLVLDDHNDAFTISFNKEVTLASYVPRQILEFWGETITGDESLTLSDGTTTQTQSLVSWIPGQQNNFTNSFTLAANTNLTITNVNTDNLGHVSWASLTVNAVPEPASYALGLGLLALSAGIYRRRSSAQAQ